MLEFKTATKGKKAKAAPIEFTIDGVKFTASAPKDSSLALLVASGASTNPAEQMHELIEFFRSCLDEDSFTRFIDLLRSKDSKFDLSDATNVLQGLITEFAGRPTE